MFRSIISQPAPVATQVRRYLAAVAVLLALGGGVSASYANTQPVSPTAAAAVNINTASADELATVLKGIGLRRAEAIVAYRQENGNFVDAYELTAISGIGDRIVEQNEAKILLREQ